MNLGSFPTRFDRSGRAPAVGLLAILAILLVLAAWPVPSPARFKMRSSVGQQSDLDLYRATIRRVAAGEPYYPVAADQLRRGGYPLKPFVTFRMPTLALAYARLPAVAMALAEGLIALAVLLMWWRRLEPELPLGMLALALVLLVGGAAALVGPVTGLFHESWAALLMALMIGIRRPGHALGAIVAGAAALLVRETVLPMILVMGIAALVERRSRESIGWAAVVALFAAALFAHAHMVATVVRPGDLASPGWEAMLGPRFALAAFAAASSANLLPAPVAAAAIILSLFGWLSVATGWALRVSLMLIGYGAMLALFARPDTFYWALLVAPLSLVGLAFVPRAIATLVRHAAGVAQPQP